MSVWSAFVGKYTIIHYFAYCNTQCWPLTQFFLLLTSTLREDLLVEVAKIASQGTFDYLIIESSGVSEPMPVAETFTFEDNTGLRLGDIAQIDTIVTVVDGSRFLSELDSILSLKERDWHTDPEGDILISHYLLIVTSSQLMS